MIAWLKRKLHSSVKIGPLWLSTWDWEAQHALCCAEIQRAWDKTVKTVKESES